MCGITAWIGEREPVRPDAFERMTDRLAARGPDGRGTWYSDDRRAALGHRRLAILDLSDAGAQPMRLAEAGLTLTYNGEVYNHREIRAELETKGHVFRSHCDAETVLRAYAAWGDACVERLSGIFAFAVWDERRGRLFAARDPLGVKPLYYCRTDGGLALASQPRAFADLPNFASRIDTEAMADYLTYGVVPGERSAFEGVSKLPPGHTLVFEQGSLSLRRYWSLPEEPDIHDPDEAARLVEKTLSRVVRAQMLSDVPVATFLSGGVDSSLVTAIATEASEAPVRTFTIGFDTERSDERPYAAAAARHCGAEPIVRTLTPGDAAQTVDDTVEAFCEPFGIGAALPMTAIARLAADHGAKVVLTGDGADELFAGYRHYDELALYYARWGRGPGDRITNPFRHLAATVRHGPFDPFTVYTAHNGDYSSEAIAKLAGPAINDTARRTHRENAWFDRDLAPVAAARRCDVHTYLTDEILVKVDRASMAYGVEARVPLLDEALVTLAFRIAPALHYANGERKALLRRAARRWLPPDILSLRKKGFSPPLGVWFNTGDGGAAMTQTIADGKLVREGLIGDGDIDAVIAALRKPGAGRLQLYLLERWAQRWTV